MMRATAALLCASLALAAAAPATAESARERYARCMELARESPMKAQEEAIAWRMAGGGLPARHCEAAALMGLGRHEGAARLYQDMAEQAPRRMMRADLLAQAGQAWLLAGAPAEALKMQNAALDLRPDDPELLVDRAFAHAEAEDLPAAVADLSQALRLQPGNADALAYRAHAQRRLGNPGAAALDAERALELAPDHPLALLERGRLARREGRVAAAHEDWRRVLAVAPQSPEASLARRSLKEDGVEP